MKIYLAWVFENSLNSNKAKQNVAPDLDLNCLKEFIKPKLILNKTKQKKANNSRLQKAWKIVSVHKELCICQLIASANSLDTDQAYSGYKLLTRMVFSE